MFKRILIGACKCLFVLICLGLLLSACGVSLGSPQIVGVPQVLVLQSSESKNIELSPQSKTAPTVIHTNRPKIPPPDKDGEWPSWDTLYEMSCDDLYALWLRFTNGTGKATSAQMSENGGYGGLIYNHCIDQRCAALFTVTMTGIIGNATFTITKKNP